MVCLNHLLIVKTATLLAIVFVGCQSAYSTLDCSVSSTLSTTFAPPQPVYNPITTTVINYVNMSGFVVRKEVQLFSDQGNANASTNISLRLNSSSLAALAGRAAANGVGINTLINTLPNIVQTNTMTRPFVEFGGNVSLNSISVGGLEMYRTVEGICSFSDLITITSDSKTVVSFPLGVGASGFAAESFGDVEITVGSVYLEASGFLGDSFLGTDGIDIESVSVIPEQDSAFETARPTINLMPGSNEVGVNANFNFEVVANSKCAGLFCSLTGASTSGISLQGANALRQGEPAVGIAAGPFQGQDGSELPPGLIIKSSLTGYIYANTTGIDIDFDGDRIDDGFDNCGEIFNAAQIDTDGDGYGNACDPDFNNDCQVNFSDVSSFAEAFLSTSENFDLNSDGAVNFLDYSILTDFFLSSPGPGLGSC